MDLLEYQAKQLFREMGIPILPSQRIDHPRDIKALQLPYPVVIKSQVRAGGRGRAGGVRFVENTIDAIAATRTIFNLPILGEFPKVLLAEAKYDADREFFLAVVLDYAQARPVLLGSPQGGINVEVVMQHLQQVVVEQEFSPYYARRLALKMGLQGSLIQSVSNIIEKMYQLFIQKDLDLVEINPLGVSSTNEVMALDGKIAVNDDALARHPDLALLTSKISSGNSFPSESATRRGDGNLRPRNPNTISIRGEDKEEISLTRELARVGEITSLNLLDREGNIGILCNGASLAMATLDLVYEAGGKPAKCLITGGDAPLSFSLTATLLESALEQLTQTKAVKVVLVNMVGSATLIEEVASGIGAYLQKKMSVQGATSPGSMPQFVIRLLGGEIHSISDQVVALPAHWVGNLEEAIAQSVSLVKSSAKKF